MSTKLDKTIARQKEKIEEGQYYEAHQQLRTITARYLKPTSTSPNPDYTSAISLLHSGSLFLLSASQGGSGGDLALYLLEVYNKAEIKPDGASKGRVLSLLRAWPRGEADAPLMKRFVGECIGWTSRLGEFPAGDPEVHHVAGVIFAEENDPYEAERHLALGTRDSPLPLSRLEYTWYSQDLPSSAGLYAGRGVFPFLLARNLRGANAFLLLFTSQMGQQTRQPPFSSDSDSQSPQQQSLPPAFQEISTSQSEIRIYPPLPLLNFLSLLLLACQRGSPDLFRNLKSHYGTQLKEQVADGAWDDALESVAEMYFGIKRPRGMGNPLMDMMGSMFGGGGGGGGGGSIGGGGGGGGSVGGGSKSVKAVPPQSTPASITAPGLD